MSGPDCRYTLLGGCLLALVWLTLAGCGGAGRSSVLFADRSNEYAVHQLNGLIERNGESEAIRYELARIYLEELEFELAVEQLEAIRRASPDDPSPAVLIAFANARSHRSDAREALERLRDTRARLGPNPEIDARLALLLLDQNRPSEAAFHARSALESALDTEMVGISYLLLSAIEASRGAKEEAEVLRRAAIEADPKLASGPDTVVRLPVYLRSSFHGPHAPPHERARQFDEWDRGE